MMSLSFPQKIWFEMHPERDCCDAFVQAEDGCLYAAVFITPAYIQRQMQLTEEMTSLQTEAEVPPVPYAVLDMAHIVVETMARETLEDAIYHLIAQDVFEGCFTRVCAEPTHNDDDSRFATQEMAAVVMHEVLRVESR
ncbi:MAG: hypothetical protein OXF83_04210 [Anaerolineaceae bacterium]|nr:hypothetical protein [Anaerolineaceae bacterium]MCY3934569.1 hypothetical protein [Chloroflexota bacterium]MCY4009493.1 hypothetical protein [Anaerolineaceae bacterium]